MDEPIDSSNRLSGMALIVRIAGSMLFYVLKSKTTFTHFYRNHFPLLTIRSNSSVARLTLLTKGPPKAQTFPTPNGCWWTRESDFRNLQGWKMKAPASGLFNVVSLVHLHRNFQDWVFVQFVSFGSRATAELMTLFSAPQKRIFSIFPRNNTHFMEQKQTRTHAYSLTEYAGWKRD